MSDYEEFRSRKSIADETQEERVERLVKGLGLLIWTAPPGFKITDRQGNLVIGCKPVMTLDEIEAWVPEHRKRR